MKRIEIITELAAGMLAGGYSTSEALSRAEELADKIRGNDKDFQLEEHIRMTKAAQAQMSDQEK